VVYIDSKLSIPSSKTSKIDDFLLKITESVKIGPDYVNHPGLKKQNNK
jgi:hypothetical protein